MQLAPLMDEPYFKVLLEEVLDERGGNLDVEADVSNSAPEVENKLRDLYTKVGVIDTKEEAQPAKGMVKYFTRIKPYWRYAAMFILIAGGVWFYAGMSKRTAVPTYSLAKKEALSPTDSSNTAAGITYTDYDNIQKNRLRIKLPDGSIVTLGAKSRIRYSNASSRREILLNGEAFFEVVKDPAKPFVVVTRDVETKVLGTSFKIAAFANRPIEVALVTGKVLVRRNNEGDDGSLAAMLPGDRVVWHNNRLIKSRIDPQTVSAWKSELLVFKKQPLKNIMETLSSQYKVKVSFVNAGFRDEKLSITIDEKFPLDKTMKVLSATAGFDYKIDSSAGRANAVIIK